MLMLELHMKLRKVIRLSWEKALEEEKKRTLDKIYFVVDSSECEVTVASVMRVHTG